MLDPIAKGLTVVSLALVCALSGLREAAGLAESAGSLAGRSDIDAFIGEMVAKHGFEREALAALFRRTRIRSNILGIMDRSSAPLSWTEYRPLFVNSERVQGGVRFWNEHAETLARARERFGVPEEIVTSVIGVETHYGRVTGRFNVLEALTTLAFEHPRRGPTFRSELEQFLLLTREEGLPPLDLKGSYAGAMGIAQFLPGSYRSYAVDFDGDGRKDLFGNAADAIGSVANYLSEHGWKPGEPIAVRADAAAEPLASLLETGLDAWQAIPDWRALGLTPVEEIAGEHRAILIDLKTAQGREPWLGFDNFYVLTRYNPSRYYAMAVYQLGRAIASARGGAEQ